LTFCAKSRGLAAKVRPPPTQMGERLEPARAGIPPYERATARLDLDQATLDERAERLPDHRPARSEFEGKLPFR